jgi:hypothetical protein
VARRGPRAGHASHRGAFLQMHHMLGQREGPDGVAAFGRLQLVREREVRVSRCCAFVSDAAWHGARRKTRKCRSRNASSTRTHGAGLQNQRSATHASRLQRHTRCSLPRDGPVARRILPSLHPPAKGGCCGSDALSRACSHSFFRLRILTLPPAPRSRTGIRSLAHARAHSARERLSSPRPQRISLFLLICAWTGCHLRGQVCSRWNDDLYVEVVRRGQSRKGRFLSLRGESLLLQHGCC